MITVVKEFTFDAAHWLPGYAGQCANLHGHTYKLQVGIKGEIDPNTGMVMDFSKLKGIVGYEIISQLDHVCLNDLKSTPGELGINFPWEMPTAENMVDWIQQRLENRWDGTREDATISFIRLYETPTSYAEWRA